MWKLATPGLVIGLAVSACTAGVSSTAAELADDLPPILNPDAPFVAFWAPFGTHPDDRTNRFFYAIATSSELDDLLEDDGSVARAELPLGLPPTRYLSTSFAVWSADGLSGNDVAPQRSETVTWPRDCVGIAPDVDGDGLLDQCDSFPTDGPSADHDKDGIINLFDNCPAVANPDQEEGRRNSFTNNIDQRASSGAACLPSESNYNAARILFPTLTVEVLNEERRAAGLSPIEWPVPQPDDLEPFSERCPAGIDPGAYGIVGDELERFEQLAEDIAALREANTGSGQVLPDRALVARVLIGFEQFNAIFSAEDSSCSVSI